MTDSYSLYCIQTDYVIMAESLKIKIQIYSWSLLFNALESVYLSNIIFNFCNSELQLFTYMNVPVIHENKWMIKKIYIYEIYANITYFTEYK